MHQKSKKGKKTRCEESRRGMKARAKAEAKRRLTHVPILKICHTKLCSAEAAKKKHTSPCQGIKRRLVRD